MEILFIYINWIVIGIGLLLTTTIYFYYRHTKSRQLLNYTPNVWTSLGILGTFVSIVYVFKGSNIDWTNINLLVQNIIPAFETSIIGIIGAIITSIATKMIYASEDKEEVDTYDKQFEYSPEQYIGLIYQQIKEQYDAIIEESKAQRSLTEKMLSDFTEKLKDFYNNMYEEEKHHMQELTEQYLSGINEIIKSTHGTIKDKFEELFIEHTNALKKLMENENAIFATLTNNISSTINKKSQEMSTAIKDIGNAQSSAIQIIANETKQQVSEIAKANEQAMSDIVLKNSTSIKGISEEIQHRVSGITIEYIKLLSTLKSEFEELTKNLPGEIENVKSELISTVVQITKQKYNTLSEDNKNFVAQLLQKIEDYEKQITMLSSQSQSQWLSATNAALTKLLNRVNDDVTSNTTLLKETTKELGGNLTMVSDTLETATKDYKSLATLIATLVAALQKETDAKETYSNSITTTNTQLSTIQKLISDVISKNLQLRQELSQWKRIHKHVKVNIETGMKECPNCHVENPVDASFCRKCATSFWECEPIEKDSIKIAHKK